MKTDDHLPTELQAILDRFSTSIKAGVFKYRLANRGIDPDDVLQEIRIKIWKTLQNEKKALRYASYINGIVNSTLVDFLRKTRQSDKLITYEQQKVLRDSARNVETAAADSRLRETIREAADSLLESRRQVVKLFLSDLTLEEISLSLNWSRDKTRNLLYRGLADLKEKLREKGVDYDHQ